MKKLEWSEHDKEWHDKEWANIKPGWHEHVISLPVIITHSDFVSWYADILDWLYDNIDNCERHCRWTFDDKFRVKFRYERDYLLCVLRW